MSEYRKSKKDDDTKSVASKAPSVAKSTMSRASLEEEKQEVYM